MPRALLLDLDGTVLDSEPWHKRSEIETFSRWGILIGPQDLLPFTGSTLPFMLDGINARFGTAITAHEFIEAQRPVFQRYIENDVKLFPDAERLIARARESGTPLGLVTSSMPWYLDAVTKTHPILEKAFDVRVCQGDVSASKPDPESFLTAAKRLGTPPEECVAVEDSVNGVASASSAGCRVVGIDREGHGRLANADVVLRSLDCLDL
jgi:HAD superfamily hydrolase (TIGR01509 family)